MKKKVPKKKEEKDPKVKAKKVDPKAKAKKVDPKAKAKKPDSEGKKSDKIFGNSYNEGTVDHQKLPELKIEEGYSSNYLSNFYNSEEYMERKELDEKIFKIFKESRWSNFSIRKKFPKDHLPHIFSHIAKELDGQGHTSVDIFISIADFLVVTYEKLYDLISVKYKEKILIELERKYKVLSGKKESRLF